MDISSEEEEPLMKSKEEAGAKTVYKEYKDTWHPVAINYSPKK